MKKMWKALGSATLAALLAFSGNETTESLELIHDNQIRLQTVYRNHCKQLAKFRNKCLGSLFIRLRPALSVFKKLGDGFLSFLTNLLAHFGPITLSEAAHKATISVQ